jgi:hypothetical protein
MGTGAHKTDIKKKAVLVALERSMGVVTIACKATGVSREQFYKWKRIDQRFRESVDEIDEMALDFVEGKQFEQINAGNTSLIIWYLKTKGKARGYIERTEQVVTDERITELRLTRVTRGVESNDELSREFNGKGA